MKKLLLLPFLFAAVACQQNGTKSSSDSDTSSATSTTTGAAAGTAPTAADTSAPSQAQSYAEPGTGYKNTQISPNPKDTLKKKVIASAANAIVPGVSIGKTKLNEPAGQLLNRLGKPDYQDAAMGTAYMIWHANHQPEGYETNVVLQHNYGVKDEGTLRIKQIRVTSPAFKLTNGIAAGASFQSINAAYQLEKGSVLHDKSGTYQLYDDLAKGVAFEFDNHKRCTAIIVHLPHDKAAKNFNFRG
jgi:hypothetical protein